MAKSWWLYILGGNLGSNKTPAKILAIDTFNYFKLIMMNSQRSNLLRTLYDAIFFLWLEILLSSFSLSFIGGVRCLSILNVVFAIIFGLLALFLGSTLLTLGSSCSLPLFWCYEIASWGLVILHGGAAFFLRRKAAVILDESDFAGRNIGLEMLEANPTEVTPDVERRVNEGFKAWMGPSLLSSDEDDEPDDYLEVPNLTHSNSTRQRV